MSRIDERLEAMKVDTSEMTTEQKFTAATGLTHYDETTAANPWYVPGGAANVLDESGESQGEQGQQGPQGEAGEQGQQGAQGGDEPTDDKGTKIDSWTLIDHRNFGDSDVQAKLGDYYSNYPTEALQDGTEWPPFTASKFPWFLINYNFDGETEVNVYYQGEKVFEGWTPTAQVEQEGGNMVDRTYGIISVPEDFAGLSEYVETVEGTDNLLDAADFEVYLIKKETPSEIEVETEP